MQRSLAQHDDSRSLSSLPILSKQLWKVAYPAVSASSGCSICRLNGAGNSRRSDLIQNSAVRPEIRITLAGIAIAAASTPGIQTRAWLPNAEPLDAETRLQKSPLKRTTACRDRNPKMRWPKVSAENALSGVLSERCGSRRMNGGVRSQMRTGLHANTLLSGNLSGNFAKFGDFSLSRTRIGATRQALIGEFPKHANREFF
jgi:hypothetical protein